MSTTGTGQRLTVSNGPEISSPNLSPTSLSSLAKVASSSRPRRSKKSKAKPTSTFARARSSLGTSSLSQFLGKVRSKMKMEIPSSNRRVPSRFRTSPTRTLAKTPRLKSQLRTRVRSGSD
uniref:Uncharacterized protein n=1 Tax=Opuntia streptacantha TaxID=393608 RepID=A0A7C9CC50_OPUST